MTSAYLQQWIQHPEMLNKDTLYELRTLLVRYPYFQSLRLLYLKNLYLLHDVTFGAELRKAVLYVADRRVLFYLIEGDRYRLKSQKSPLLSSRVPEEEPNVDRTLSLIDAFLATVPEEHSQVTELDYAMDYTTYLLQDDGQNDSEPTGGKEVPKLRGHELIDGFIRKSESSESSVFERSVCPEKVLVSPEEKEASLEDKEVISEQKETFSASLSKNEYSTSEDDENDDGQIRQEDVDDSCFTETLAKIYIKQHRYDKALEIIKKLSLNYPKKNAYFADQIRLMCFIVLIQNSKGGGLASGFSSSNQIMGVRKTTDFLEKATWSLAVFLVVMSVASAYVIPSASHKGGDVILEQAQQEEKTNPYNMPVGTAAPKAEQPAETAPATTAPAATDAAEPAGN